MSSPRGSNPLMKDSRQTTNEKCGPVPCLEQGRSDTEKGHGQMSSAKHATSPSAPEPETNLSGLAALRVELAASHARDSRPGERNPRARLTAEQVMEIYRSTDPREVVAARYGVSAQQVFQIRDGSRWSSVTGHVYTPRRNGGAK